MATKTGALVGRADTYEKRAVGIVTATVGERSIKLVMEGEKTFKNGKKEIKVSLESLPKFPKITPKSDGVDSPQNGKKFRVRMNQDGDEVEALTPVDGVYRLKLVDIGPRPNGKDSDPIPYEKQSEWKGKDTSHLEFWVSYKITRGYYKSVITPAFYLHYKFEDDGDGMTRFAGNPDNPKATNLAKLITWGTAHGLYDEPIEWDDVTILPTLLERALENDVEVDGLFKDGYIREVMPVQDDDDEVEETPKQKRPIDAVIDDLGYGAEVAVKAVKKAIVGEEPADDDLNVDRDFPKDEPKKAKKAAKKVAKADDDDSDL